MKKAFFVLIIAFAAGFLTHAFFFPEFLANGITKIPQVILPNTTPTQQAARQDFETKITFDGQRFNRHNITIEVGSYLIITNTSSSHKMWLVSNNSLLGTPRPYGESETVRERMDDRGQFVVADKNNPEERLIITVK